MISLYNSFKKGKFFGLGNIGTVALIIIPILILFLFIVIVIVESTPKPYSTPTLGTP